MIDKVQELKVSADEENISQDQRKRNVKKLAGAISHSLRQSGEVNVRCFGNASIGKASKAIAISKSYIKENNLQLSFSPAYINADIGGKSRTGIAFCLFTSDGDDIKDFESVKQVMLVRSDADEATYEEKNDSVKKLAGAIAHALAEDGECFIRCFGNGTIGKACRALAMARGFVAQKGSDMYCTNTFIEAEMGGASRTGIGFYAYSNTL
jgi:stage V sporulation protein S